MNKKLTTSTLAITVFLLLAAGNITNTPQKFGSHFVKPPINSTVLAKTTMSSEPVQYQQKTARPDYLPEAVETTNGGRTLEIVPLYDEASIQKLTKTTVRNNLSRQLFGLPQNTASYYRATYNSDDLLVESLYLQIISDPLWNRIVYGSLDGKLKTFDDIKSPGEIVVSPDGKVYVTEKPDQRIRVLKINAQNGEPELNDLYTIDGITEPGAITFNDGGTPTNANDDQVFVVDAAKDIIRVFSVGDNSAAEVSVYNGFQSPTALTCGRSNGANNGYLYVVDYYGKHLTLYKIQDNDLNKIAQIENNENGYYSKITTDHFGQLYVADAVKGEISKYTSDLVFLDKIKVTNAVSSLNDISIPFGLVSVDGETYWAGFDQLFSLERWDNNSGAERVKLGLALKNTRLAMSVDNDQLAAGFKLTDFAKVKIEINDVANHLIATLSYNQMPSGDNYVTWNRKDESGEQVTPGTYTFNLTCSSLYDDEQVGVTQNFHLPLYYHIHCGETKTPDQVVLMEGTVSTATGSGSVEGNRITYLLKNLDPESSYQVKFALTQADSWTAFADDQQFTSSSEDANSYYTIPPEALKDNQVYLTIESGNTAAVFLTDLWIKETGRSFEIQNTKQKEIPTNFALEPNFPNPFNPDTHIRYQLPEDAQVVLDVFDIMGRKIKTLVHGYQTSGIHTVDFNASNLASGVYFYKIKAGAWQANRKMLLVK